MSLKCHDKFKTPSFSPEKETENKNEVAKTISRAEGEPHQKTDIQSKQKTQSYFYFRYIDANEKKMLCIYDLI